MTPLIGPAPKGPDNQLHRLAVNHAADNPKRRALFLDRAAHDIVWWIDTFVYQYNPAAIGEGSEEVGPFVLWPFQEPALATIQEAIDHQHDLVIEKSREMGASWLCLLTIDHQFLFRKAAHFIVVSRDEDSVDEKDNPQSLFPKIDFIHDHLPPWMSEGRIRIPRAKLRFKNPLTRSTIVGEASTKKAGVGGRGRAMFVDEFAQIDADYQIFHRTASTTRCRIFNSTHLGTGTCFYEITHGKLAGAYPKLTMHWSEHPDKAKGLYEVVDGKVKVLDTKYEYPPDFKFVLDGSPAGGLRPRVRSPWYDAECARRGSTWEIARDLDVDCQGSTHQFFNRLRIAELRNLHVRDPKWGGDLEYDRFTGEPRGLRRNPDGRLKLWVHPNVDKAPFGRYTIGCDPAAGTGATPSCVSVFDVDRGEKVAEYIDPFIEAGPLAVFLVALARLFRTKDGDGAKLCWELPGPGLSVSKNVRELGYRNVWYNEDQSKWGRRPKSDIAGYMNRGNATMLPLLDAYRRALYDQSFINRSDKALEECLEFHYQDRGEVKHSQVESSDDPSGARVNHGDRVIADALAWLCASRAGAGSVPTKPKEVVEIGSLGWRRMLAEREERQLAEF